MTRPRAADDFATIRARIEELRRERSGASAEPDARPLPPRPYHNASPGSHNAEQRRLLAAIRQKFFRGKTNAAQIFDRGPHVRSLGMAGRATLGRRFP
jgi:hypothetical protein